MKFNVFITIFWYQHVFSVSEEKNETGQPEKIKSRPSILSKLSFKKSFSKSKKSEVSVKKGASEISLQKSKTPSDDSIRSCATEKSKTSTSKKSAVSLKKDSSKTSVVRSPSDTSLKSRTSVKSNASEKSQASIKSKSSVKSRASAGSVKSSKKNLSSEVSAKAEDPQSQKSKASLFVYSGASLFHSPRGSYEWLNWVGVQ